MSPLAIDQDAKNGPRPDLDGPHDGTKVVHDSSSRRSVFTREKDEFGGVKVGLAFFGWLTATGTAVMLTALVAAAGTAVGVATNTDASTVTTQAAQDPKTVSIVGAVALLVVLFVAFYCGGTSQVGWPGFTESDKDLPSGYGPSPSPPWLPSWLLWRATSTTC